MASTLVMGATGTVGRELVKALASRGTAVRAFVRDRGRAESILGPGVDLALGDLNDPASVEAALAGVSRLFLLPPADPRQGERDRLVVEAARRVGVEHVVKLSALNSAPDSTVDDLRWHHEGEQALVESGLAHTILRCNFFAQFFLIFAPSIRAESIFRAPVVVGRVSPVDARDIAASAAAVLTAPNPESGRIHELTGTESLSYPEVAERLSVAVGRRIEYVPVTPGECWWEMLAAGRPEWEARILLQLYERIDLGDFARVTSAVETLTGRAPTSFDQFARDYRGAFARL